MRRKQESLEAEADQLIARISDLTNPLNSLDNLAEDTLASTKTWRKAPEELEKEFKMLERASSGVKSYVRGEHIRVRDDIARPAEDVLASNMDSQEAAMFQQRSWVKDIEEE